MNRSSLAAAIGGAVLCADFLTKYIATLYFDPPISVIPGFFSLVLHHNPGLAFSVPLPNYLQIILSFGLLIALGIYWRNEARSLYETIALSAIVGGALGNLAERILYKSVTDFVAVWQFPVFNVADSAISLGVLALIGYELLGSRQSREAGGTNSAA